MTHSKLTFESIITHTNFLMFPIPDPSPTFVPDRRV